MPDKLHAGVDLVRAEGGAGRIGLQLGGELQVGPGPAERGLDRFPGGLCARTGTADVDPLPLEIFDVANLGIPAGQDGHQLGIEGQDGPQVGIGRALPVPSSFVGGVLHVGLHEREVELARPQPVHVEDRADRRLGRAAHAMVPPPPIDQIAQGATDRIVEAGNGAGPDRHETRLGRRRGGTEHQHRDHGERERPTGASDCCHHGSFRPAGRHVPSSGSIRTRYASS